MSPSTTRPTLAILASTLLWGTWWVPLRKLDALGGGAVTLGGLAIVLAAFLPLLIVRRRRLLRADASLWLSALFFAVTLTLYAEALLRAQVARVVLLFYLTPVWSTLLARWMLNEPITKRRMLTLAFGLTGLAIILGIDNANLAPRNLGECFGLLAGATWGLALVYTHRAAHHRLADKVALQFLFAVIVFAALTALPGGREAVGVVVDETLRAGVDATRVALTIDAGLWLLGFAFVWNLPVVWLTFYGAGKIEPGRVALLLLLEVVIGVGSAALFAGEPFGAREFFGALFIIAAGVIEFVPPARRAS